MNNLGGFTNHANERVSLKPGFHIDFIGLRRSLRVFHGRWLLESIWVVFLVSILSLKVFWGL